MDHPNILPTVMDHIAFSNPRDFHHDNLQHHYISSPHSHPTILAPILPMINTNSASFSPPSLSRNDHGVLPSSSFGSSPFANNKPYSPLSTTTTNSTKDNNLTLPSPERVVKNQMKLLNTNTTAVTTGSNNNSPYSTPSPSVYGPSLVPIQSSFMIPPSTIGLPTINNNNFYPSNPYIASAAVNQYQRGMNELQEAQLTLSKLRKSRKTTNNNNRTINNNK